MNKPSQSYLNEYTIFSVMRSLSVSTHNSCCHSSLPLAAANPLADHDVQAGLRSAVLRRGGGCRPGQGQHAGHRPQTVLRPVRPAGERTEGRLHCSRSEGAVPGVGEHLTRTPYPTRPWGPKRSFLQMQRRFVTVQFKVHVENLSILRGKPPARMFEWGRSLMDQWI